MLAVLRDEFGTLDRIGGVVKLSGFVNAIPGFERQPKVIDGASRLMHEVFGEAGIHARSSLGVESLPNNIPVEIEGIFELKRCPWKDQKNAPFPAGQLRLGLA